MGAIHASNFTEQLFRVVGRGLFRGLYLRHGKPYSEDKTEEDYVLYNRKHEKVVSFRARPLPGCCGVLVVYYLRPDGRAKEPQKVFTDTLNLIVEAAGLAKFGAVLLTQTRDSAGFKALTEPPPQPIVTMRFANHKTGNDITAFMIVTKAPDEEPKKAAFSGE